MHSPLIYELLDVITMEKNAPEQHIVKMLSVSRH